jgi:hypothetical protein
MKAEFRTIPAVTSWSLGGEPEECRVNGCALGIAAPRIAVNGLNLGVPRGVG